MEIVTTYELRAFSTLYDWILPDVRGFEKPLVDQKILEAAREFCSTTRCWRETLDPIITVANEPQYEIEGLDQAALLEVVHAELDGMDITPARAKDYRARERAETGTPSSRLAFYGDVIVLHPTPTQSGSVVTVEAYLTPSNKATQLPSFVADAYPETIARGAKAYLYEMSSKPWSDPARAERLMREFSLECQQVAWVVAGSHQGARQRIPVVHKVVE